jgi:hypothetical protein
VDKLPELGRQLGMQVDKFDLATDHGLMVFYRQLALNLAVRFEIPGFMETEHKWDPAIVYFALQDAHRRRKRGEPDPALNACLMVVQGLDRKLRRKDQKLAAIQRAKTLRNEVNKLRHKMRGVLLFQEILECYHKNTPGIS